VHPCPDSGASDVDLDNDHDVIDTEGVLVVRAGGLEFGGGLAAAPLKRRGRR
jgi:hypothetical protein